MQNEDDIEFPRELRVSAENHGKFEDLAKTDVFAKFDAPMKEIFVYAMALGFANKTRIPLGSSIGSVPSRLLSEEQRWLIRSIAIAKANDMEVLFDMKSTVILAEEYANGGINLLYELILDPHNPGAHYKKLDAHVRGFLKQSVEEHFVQEPAVIDLASLIQRGENENIEFKSSCRWDYDKNCVNKDLETVIAKSLAAFLNAKGGILVIGINDDGNIIGIEKDLATIGKQNQDGYELKIREIVNNFIGRQYGPLIHLSFETVSGKLICAITIDHSPTPCYVNVNNKMEFYVRSGNSSQPLNVKEATDYIANHW